MGVTGLWTVVAPCARPIKIETLNKKRLAVDASIWIYQFLKAVRDKEGNALRNSHVVGFFRRICKLLFYGIKPVFVFDGGAPALKRQTIAGRKARREGRRDDAVRTAGKLLALQMQRRAEEEEQRRRETVSRPAVQEEEAVKEDELVYVDELHMTQQERQKTRSGFRKKDQYHLPDLDVPLAEMGGPNDPRIMSMEELQTYARQFDTGEDINVYDFSKIDFESPFFTSLPATDRYNILNAARLRSRLRMGYSKDQLDTMFPDRMAFSRFQIDRVRERNELTQRLMAVGTADELDAGGRVAGEKGREYVLVKNPGVEGGWALGVIGDRDKEEGQRNKPINVDELAKQANVAEQVDESSSEEEAPGVQDDDIVRRRKEFYSAQKAKAGIRRSGQAEDEEDVDALFVNDSRKNKERNDGAADSEEEAEIQRAIAMSLQREKPAPKESDSDNSKSDSDEEFYDNLIEQSKAQEFRPFAGMTSGGVANLANKRAAQAVPRHVQEESSDEEGTSLDQIRAKSRQQVQPKKPRERPTKPPSSQPDKSPTKQFDGPLPFEKLDLGTSLLGKKKMEQLREKDEGGFEKKDNEEKNTEPLPPWFEGDLQKGISAQKVVEHEDITRNQRLAEQEAGFLFESRPRLRKQDTTEVIDLDAEEEKKKTKTKQTIFIESSDEDEEMPEVQIDENEPEEPRLGDAADKLKADPPRNVSPAPLSSDPAITKPLDEREANEDEPLEWDESDHEQAQSASEEIDVRLSLKNNRPAASPQKEQEQLEDPGLDPRLSLKRSRPMESESETSEHGSMEASSVSKAAEITEAPEEPNPPKVEEADDSSSESASDRSSSPDVYIPDNMDEMVAAAKEGKDEPPPAEGVEDGEDLGRLQDSNAMPADDEDADPVPVSGAADQDMPAEDDPAYGSFSDPEDEALIQSLATEAEEHARFASTLNQKSYAQNIEEYERELAALRSQQKRDRRDADEVTHIMITECQQLLKLFGLPFITAPMEAEAQCAELVKLGLVDGIVTDDSDCFLFGGTRIYKNMFNSAKFVECYLASDLARDFDLSRERLVRIAQLLGSDYTEGLPGIGPVTALEILSEFPDGLEGFKEWWTRVQTADPTLQQDPASSHPFRKKFKKNATKLFLPPAFPDSRVDAAYLYPDVDSDPSAFQWGVPDLSALRAFLMATIGWGPERTDEVLVPVIRDMNRREQEGTQANITQFLPSTTTVGVGGQGSGAFAPRVRNDGKSKRMASALSRMAERAKMKRRAQTDRSGDVEQGEKDGDDHVAPEDAIVAVEGSGVPVVSMGHVAQAARQADHSTSNVEEDEEEGARPVKKRKTASRKQGTTKGKRKAKA